MDIVWIIDGAKYYTPQSAASALMRATRGFSSRGMNIGVARIESTLDGDTAVMASHFDYYLFGPLTWGEALRAIYRMARTVRD